MVLEFFSKVGPPVHKATTILTNQRAHDVVLLFVWGFFRTSVEIEASLLRFLCSQSEKFGQLYPALICKIIHVPYQQVVIKRSRTCMHFGCTDMLY